LLTVSERSSTTLVPGPAQVCCIVPQWSGSPARCAAGAAKVLGSHLRPVRALHVAIRGLVGVVAEEIPALLILHRVDDVVMVTLGSFRVAQRENVDVPFTGQRPVSRVTMRRKPG
jgi:hypothetical protein